MRIGIMTGGTVEPDFVQEYCRVKPVDQWIGVDHGMEALHAMNVIPCCIVGDFDSVDPEVLAYYRAQPDIDWHVFSPIKDDTDTELAIRQALERKPEEIVIFGGTGSRFDHVLGTVHVTKKAMEQGVHCEVMDRHNRIYLLNGRRVFRRAEIFGPYLSFLPFDGVVRGLTLEGFKYPLQEMTVEPGTSLTISNELAAEEGRFTLREGIVICVEARD